MIVLDLENEAMMFLKEARRIALKSSCLRSKCGSVIVKDGEIIGSGYNSPPLDKKLDCCLKDELPQNFVSDRTCCVHAEQRAIMDALKNNASKIAGSRLYFIRLDEKGEMAVSGEPYCTICSKMALDAGIVEFVLLRKEGICVYETEEYNRKSFEFRAI